MPSEPNIDDKDLTKAKEAIVNATRGGSSPSHHQESPEEKAVENRARAVSEQMLNERKAQNEQDVLKSILDSDSKISEANAVIKKANEEKANEKKSDN